MRCSSRGRRLAALYRNQSGQATVEAAFLLPVLFLLLLLLLQPAILLYDHLVMQGAAAEGCRLLVTADGGSGGIQVGGHAHVSPTSNPYQSYVLRRLGAIPLVPAFHLHEGECSYVIDMEGGEGSQTVSVSITNKVRLLPLVGQAASVLGIAERGVYTQVVSVSMPGGPAWTTGSPDEWAQSWE